MRTDPDLLNRAADAAMAVLDDLLAEEKLVVEHCILATRIMIEVAQYAGLDAKPLPVGVMALNRAALPYIEAGVPVSKWSNDEAWSLGVFRGNGQPGPGHVVARVGDVLIDLSVRQFDREQRDMRFPHGPLLSPLDGWWTREVPMMLGFAERRPCGEDDWDSALIYWPDPNDDFRASRDWKRNYKPLAAKAIRQLRR